MSEKVSCVSHAPNTIFMRIMSDFVGICIKANAPDAACAAAILSYFENWMNTKLTSQVQAKTRNKIDETGGNKPTQDESLWVYISQSELQDSFFSLFGINKINDSLKWLREQNLLLCRENPEHKWDRTLQYMLNVEKIQSLLDAWIKAGDFNIKVSKPSKKRIGALKKKSPDVDNKQAIPKIVLDSSLESIQEKESSSLRAEDAPLNTIGEVEEETTRLQSQESTVQNQETAQEETDSSEITSVNEPAALPEAEQADPDPIAPEELEAVEASEAVRQAEEHVEEITDTLSKKELNSQYQEAMRRALAKPDKPLKAGDFVGRYIKFVRGTYQKGDKNAKDETLNYQLTEQPMSPYEIVALTLWCRRECGLEKIPHTLATLRRRVDEFRALSDHATWVAEGQKRLEQIMIGLKEGKEIKLDAAKPATNYAKAQKPPSRDDMQEFNLEEFERTL